MTLTIDLPKDQLDRFLETARQLGVKPEDLAAAALAELLSRPSDEFQRAATHVLRKNAELYKRLS